MNLFKASNFFHSNKTKIFSLLLANFVYDYTAY